MNLNKKNITYFDLETTGLDISTSKIVQIYAVNYKKKYELKTKVNPEIDIPIKASEIHDIFNEDVQNSPKFRDIKDVITLTMSSKYICGYNIMKYDIPILINLCKEENIDINFERTKFIDIFYIVKQILTDEEKQVIGNLTLFNIYHYYTNKELNAHNAESDVKACVEILKIINKKIRNLEKYFLSCEDIKGYPISSLDYILKFGKHSFKSIREVIKLDPGYIQWLKNKKTIINLLKLEQSEEI